jgi:hypothetical protein
VLVLDYALRCAINEREVELGFTLVSFQNRRVPVVETVVNPALSDLAMVLLAQLALFVHYSSYE